MAEADACVQEQSAVDKKTVDEISKLATEDQPYIQVLFCKTEREKERERESDINKMFVIRLEKAMHFDA